MIPQQAYGNLVEAIAKGALAIVGAGSSCRVKYPSWLNLVGQLGERAAQAHPDQAAHIAALKVNKDYLIVAGEFEDLLGRDVARAVIRR